jgi:hypothetical protein
MFAYGQLLAQLTPSYRVNVQHDMSRVFPSAPRLDSATLQSCLQEQEQEQHSAAQHGLGPHTQPVAAAALLRLVA